MLAYVTQERVDQPVSTGPTGKDADTDCASKLAQQAELGSDLSLREEVATGVDCCDFVVGGPTSASLSSAAGCVDFAGDVAVGVTYPAVFAGVVTVGVASLAYAGVASSTDLAGGVTVGVTSLADLGGDVTVGVASLADAGVASLADLAGSVAGEVTFVADTDCASKLAELMSDLSLREEVVTGVDCCDFVVGGPNSASLSSAAGCVDFTGDVVVGVTSDPGRFCWGCHRRCGLPGRFWGGVLGPILLVTSPSE